MVAEPFIEYQILDNADDIDEFLRDHGYNSSDVMLFLCKDEEFGGWYAEIALSSDEEIVAVTATWSSKKELKTFLVETLGSDYEISEHE